MYGVELWILWKADQKYLENSEILSWRRMEKIIWIDRVKNEGLLHRSKAKRNIRPTNNKNKG